MLFYVLVAVAVDRKVPSKASKMSIRRVFFTQLINFIRGKGSDCPAHYTYPKNEVVAPNEVQMA